MTHTRQYADGDGDFGGWKDHSQSCHKLVPSEVDETPYGMGIHRPVLNRLCGSKVQVRTWESSCGGYEDYQYRCESGHTWWIDGIDS